MKRAVLLAAAILLPSGAGAQIPQPGPVWPKLSPAQQSEVMKFGDDFKTFIGRAVSEMTFVREATALVEANGFKRWPAETLTNPPISCPKSRCLWLRCKARLCRWKQMRCSCSITSGQGNSPRRRTPFLPCSRTSQGIRAFSSLESPSINALKD